MLYAYIGAAVVVGLLIGFVLLCVIWISKKVSESIRIKTIDLVSAYDTLLEERSLKLAEVEQKLNRLQAPSAAAVPAAEPLQVPACTLSGGSILNAAERIGTAVYRDTSVGQTYRKIKGTFQLDPTAALEALQRAAGTQTAGAATLLLAELPYDTVYQLSMLPEDEQVRILRESLSGSALALLDNYRTTHEAFGAIAFYDHLRAAAAMEPQPPRLRVSPLDRGTYPAGIEVIVDPDICEGFQIEFNNTLYDYCIKGRELS